MIINNDPTIISFTKTALPNGYLGNMFSSPIEYDGKVWKTAEALFQALRFGDDSIREMIRNDKSPFGLKLKVKTISDQMIITPKGEQDIENMRLVLRLKFYQHPILRDQLLSTGNAVLIEDVTKRKSGNSTFWGASLEGDEWVGKNKLGELLMELREELMVAQ
jgi:ribA/ribD-fused uncharacterized protein